MSQGRSPYMNLREVADYTRALRADGSPDTAKARKWVYKEKLTLKFRGRNVLVRREEVEVALNRKQHARIVPPAKVIARQSPEVM